MKRKELNLQNDLHSDFMATTKVAELLENGDVGKEGIAIIPAGPARSAYAKDINGHSAYYSENLLKDRLIIEVNREGLYDMLPEGLFHGSPARSAGLSELEMIADVQLRRTEEKDARRFFMPFEAELNHMRTLLAWYENRLDKKTTYNDLSMIFGAEWKEFDLLDNDQRIIWMHLLPVIQQKRNDAHFMGKLLSVLFNIPVHVTLNPAAVIRVSVGESMRCKMGNGALGSDTVIGSSFVTEGEEICIKIGPVDAGRLLAFLPGSHQAQLIETVTAYLVPVETNIRVELTTSQENRIGSLGAGSANSILGFTVYL